MSVASKNPFDLLGGDTDEPTAPAAAASAPRKDAVKRDTTSKKRETPAPSATSSGDSRGGYGQRRGRGGAGEGGFRDRGAGGGYRSGNFEDSGNPQRRDNREHRDRGERPRRGGRGGGTFRNREMDRHSATGKVDTDKQVSQGWGAVQGDSEWNDEQAGQNIANQEAGEDFVPVEGGAEGATAASAAEEGGEQAAPAEPEPEDNTKSFADYMAELELKSPVAELPEARRANEGARDNKKWAGAKELTKDEDDDYIAGGKTKSKAVKPRKEKMVVDIDQRYIEPRDRRGGDRGRGGGGRGGGDRGDRRGGRGGGGEYRGERRGGYGQRGGSNGGPVNIQDNSAFPSLGK